MVNEDTAVAQTGTICYECDSIIEDKSAEGVVRRGKVYFCNSRCDQRFNSSVWQERLDDGEIETDEETGYEDVNGML